MLSLVFQILCDENQLEKHDVVYSQPPWDECPWREMCSLVLLFNLQHGGTETMYVMSMFIFKNIFTDMQRSMAKSPMKLWSIRQVHWQDGSPFYDIIKTTSQDLKPRILSYRTFLAPRCFPIWELLAFTLANPTMDKCAGMFLLLSHSVAFVTYISAKDTFLSSLRLHRFFSNKSSTLCPFAVAVLNPVRLLDRPHA